MCVPRIGEVMEMMEALPCPFVFFFCFSLFVFLQFLCLLLDNFPLTTPVFLYSLVNINNSQILFPCTSKKKNSDSRQLQFECWEHDSRELRVLSHPAGMSQNYWITSWQHSSEIWQKSWPLPLTIILVRDLCTVYADFRKSGRFPWENILVFSLDKF